MDRLLKNIVSDNKRMKKLLSYSGWDRRKLAHNLVVGEAARLKMPIEKEWADRYVYRLLEAVKNGA